MAVVIERENKVGGRCGSMRFLLCENLENPKNGDPSLWPASSFTNSKFVSDE